GGESIEWSTGPDVYAGFLSDIYLYVAGSSFVERQNEQAKSVMQPGSDSEPADSSDIQKLLLGRGQTVSLGGFDITFKDYAQADMEQMPDSTMIAVNAHLEVVQKATGNSKELRPLFAIYNEGGKSWVYAPPLPFDR